MKLSNIYPGNTLVITQTAHGRAQGYKAFDFVGAKSQTLIAPCDGRIEPMGYSGSGQRGDQYFRLHGKGFFIEFVHYRPIREGHVKRGQRIGVCTFKPIHSHVAINVGGKWDLFLKYLDRGVKLRQARHFNWSSFRHERWSTYSDLQLPGSGKMEPMSRKFYDLIKKHRPDVWKHYQGDWGPINKWWKHSGEKELTRALTNIGRWDVFHHTIKKSGFDLRDWYIDYGSEDHPDLWKWRDGDVKEKGVTESLRAKDKQLQQALADKEELEERVLAQETTIDELEERLKIADEDQPEMPEIKPISDFPTSELLSNLLSRIFGKR